MSELLSGFDPPVIAALGLDAQAIQTEYLNHIRARAENAYSSHRHYINVLIVIPYQAINIEHKGDFSLVPTLLRQQWNELKEEYAKNHPTMIGLAEASVTKYIEAIGIAALRKTDFKTAISAFDEVTEGGALNRKELTDSLKVAVQNKLHSHELTGALELAGLLQKSVNTRKPTSSSEN